ncbi:MAG: hypothetical protein R2852_09965 [Bacteroidia bacterium]
MVKFVSLGIIILAIYGLSYNYGSSIQMSIILFIILIAFIVWVIRYELRILLDKEDRDERKNRINEGYKKSLDKERENNSTL